MNNEILKRANELSSQIKELESELNKWNLCTDFADNTISIFGTERERYHAMKDYVDFDVVKTLTMSKIEKKLKELKEEFDKL